MALELLSINMKEEINVIVDITKEQLLPDSGDKFQVQLSKLIPVDSDIFNADGTPAVDVFKKEVDTTSLGELKDQLADLDSQIAVLESRRSGLETKIAEITIETDKAIATLQEVDVLPVEEIEIIP